MREHAHAGAACKRATAVLAVLAAVASLQGCLPNLASDAELEQRLRTLATTDGHSGNVGDGAGLDATLDDGVVLGDAADVGDAGNTDDGSNSDSDSVTDVTDVTDDSDVGAPDGDGGANDDVAGTIGKACSNTSNCVAPSTVAPCRTPICADGVCALTTVPAGTACSVQGLTLDPCKETRCSATGSCEVVTAADGAACDADNFGCTGPDQCKGGACVVGAAVVCPQGDQSCAPVACVSTGTKTSICQPSFKSTGTACDDGKVCTVADACDGGGVCVGLPNPCTSVSAPCAVASCDAAKDACIATPKAKGDACDDGTGCFKPGTCGSNGVCSGQQAICDDGNPCTDDVCDQKGGCAYVPHTGPCNDGDACTISDTCDGKGGCAKGKPRLFDTSFAAAQGAQPRAALSLSDGSLLLVGQRNQKPWRMRADSLGAVIQGVTEASPEGAWAAAIERKDGLLLAGISAEAGKNPVPMLRRFGTDGKPQWTSMLFGEAGEDAAITAMLAGADDTLLLLAIGRAGPSQSSIVRLLLWSETNKNSVTGQEFTFGGASESRVLRGGAYEASAKRWVLAGRRQLSGSFKGWKGWIHRVNESMLFGGEADYLPTGALAGDLQAVAVIADGYLAVGSATSSTDGHEDGWIVRADDKLAPLWQQTMPTQAGTSVLFDVRMSSWGEILGVGVSETGPNAADTASTVWRLSGNGATLNQWSWPSSGGSLFAARALSDGWLVLGAMGLGSQRTPQMLRTTPWLQASCAAAGSCAALAASACDDGNPCTASDCVAGLSCQNTPLAAGALCGGGKTCSAFAVCN